jgi:MFS family permease
MALADPDSRSQVRRIGWLHFLNDFTLDFLTPLLPAGMPAAWVGLMEGLADGVGQALKIVTGRASDRSGRRASWVGGGYLMNAVARPLTAIGMLLSLPLWIVGCRVADRIGKGLRGSATDALVADWTSGEARTRAYARMRTMDHLGAAAGGAAAALAAWQLAPEHLWWAVAALAVPALLVAWIARGLRDAPDAATKTPTDGWWPREPGLGRPLLATGLATAGVKLSPLLILVHVAGLPADGGAGHWPLWAVCVGWSVFGLVQAASSWAAEGIAARIGPAAMARWGWLAGAIAMAGLAVASGPWLIVAGLATGIVLGATEGAEKAWLAELCPKHERARTFGALALIAAAAGLAGNGLVGWLLVAWGSPVFLVAAGLGLLAVAVAARRGGR